MAGEEGAVGGPRPHAGPAPTRAPPGECVPVAMGTGRPWQPVRWRRAAAAAGGRPRGPPRACPLSPAAPPVPSRGRGGGSAGECAGRDAAHHPRQGAPGPLCPCSAGTSGSLSARLSAPLPLARGGAAAGPCLLPPAVQTGGLAFVPGRGGRARRDAAPGLRERGPGPARRRGAMLSWALWALAPERLSGDLLNRKINALSPKLSQ